MTSMEREALNVIAEKRGWLHYYLLAYLLKISAHYSYVICKGLQRNGYINFDSFRGICNLTQKGEDTVEKDWILTLKCKKAQNEKVRECVEFETSEVIGDVVRKNCGLSPLRKTDEVKGRA